jgi:hypothetical protein
VSRKRHCPEHMDTVDLQRLAAIRQKNSEMAYSGSPFPLRKYGCFLCSRATAGGKDICLDCEKEFPIKKKGTK